MAAKKGGFLKKLVIGAGGLALLAVAGLAAAIHFVNWNALKDKGAAYLTQTLHHKVSIGSIDAELFSGITLGKLQIANAAGYGSQPLFSNDEAKLRISFLSLLTGKLVISEIEFKNPHVYVVKDAHGKFNFSDMSKASKAPAAAKGESSSSASAPNVIITSFRLNGGDLTFKDLGKGTTQAVKGLDILLSGFSLQAGGNSRLEVKLVIENEGKKIPVDLAANFSLDLGGQELKILSSTLKVPSLEAQVSGTVSKFLAQPEIDISAEAKASLDTLVADLAPPSTLKSLPDGLKSSGEIVLKLALKGKTAEPKSMGFDGSLSFNKVGLKYASDPAISDMNGTLSLGPTKASMPALQFNMEGSPVTFKLQASDYSLGNLMGPTDKIRIKIRYEITSPKLILDPLLALSGSDNKVTEAATGKADKSGGMADYRRTVSKDIDLYGEINVETAQIKAMKFGKFTYKTQLLRQKFEGDMGLDLFEGHFSANTNADLSVVGPAYSFQTTLSKMQLQACMDAAADSFPEKKLLGQLKGKLTGTMAFNASGKGHGLKAPATTKNIDMKGQFQVLDGKIAKTNLQEALAAAIPHPATAEALRKDIHFGQILSDFSLKSNVMKLNSFELSSGADKRQGDMLILANGQMNVGGAVDFHIAPHFNPRLVKLDGVAQEAFEDDKGWATYNAIEYLGPTMDQAKADFKQGAGNAVKQVAQKEATKYIQNNGQNLIKQLPAGLQGLFGK